MSRHQHCPGVPADPQPYAPQPPLDLVLLLALTGIPRHHIQGAAGEEELMSNPVYLLAAEIPPSHRHIPASRGIMNSDWRDLYAMRSRPPFDERGRPQRGDQRSLADVALADHQQLRLVLRLGIIKTAQVRGKLSRPPLGKLRQRVSQRIPLQTQLKESPRTVTVSHGQRICGPPGQPTRR
jgi:hypothetical protein